MGPPRLGFFFFFLHFARTGALQCSWSSRIDFTFQLPCRPTGWLWMRKRGRRVRRTAAAGNGYSPLRAEYDSRIGPLIASLRSLVYQRYSTHGFRHIHGISPRMSTARELGMFRPFRSATAHPPSDHRRHTRPRPQHVPLTRHYRLLE